jgi:hypothetical protein
MIHFTTFAPGEMAERSIAAVLKTVDCNRSGGSNPSLSANPCKTGLSRFFYFKPTRSQACLKLRVGLK